MIILSSIERRYPIMRGMDDMTIRRYMHEEYPEQLQVIDAAPDEMEIVGSMPAQHKFLAIVGSRHNSDYGADACSTLIAGLAGYPIAIVSGLAIGIDSIAHEAALAAGLPTVAFPGSGLGQRALYPSSKRALARRIVESGGALVSPFPRDQKGALWTFPTRNELMAGISHAVLIVEAAKGSGTLITADHALEFGRDVLVVPGSIFSELSYGPHMLASRGATLVKSYRDILVALGFEPPDTGDPRQQDLELSGGDSHSSDSPLAVNLSDTEKQIYDLLRLQSCTATDIALHTGLGPSTLNITLISLEIHGLIRESGGTYRTIRSLPPPRI